MGSRVHGFGRVPAGVEVESVRVEEPEVVAARYRPAVVDKAVVNEAVEATLEKADPKHVSSMMSLWTVDTDSPLAKVYFADAVRSHMHSRFAEMARKPHTVNEVLTADEAALVTSYAREFNLTFRNRVGNEHGLFSARRVIDHQIIASSYPPSMPVLDFGGSVQHHVRNGNTHVRVISPYDVDSKDPARGALTRMALKVISRDETAPAVQRRMADSVLRGEGTYHLAESVQTTNARAPVSMAVHVYDVPMEDWPDMMHRCGVRVHEGCVHFVNDFFESDAGEFPYSGAHYEIDREKDIFRMRAGAGSTMWYEHRWSDFMKYGANQVLHTSHGAYAYQITSRRQDTIFYRILRVDTNTFADNLQVYALPSVPMVEVDGFEVSPVSRPHGVSGNGTLVKRSYVFPQALWERMVGHAAAEVDRGGISYEKLFNFYRTVVPAQTINGVHVSGGQKVPIDEVPALVVMSAVVAYADILLMQRTTQAVTGQAKVERAQRDESTLYKGFSAFVSALVGIGCLPFSPFEGLGSKVADVYLATMRDKLVSWRPQVRIRSLNMAVIVDHDKLGYCVRSPEDVEDVPRQTSLEMHRMIDLARNDPDVARDLLAVCGDTLTAGARRTLDDVASTTTLVDSGVSVASDERVSDAKTDIGTTWFMKGDKKIRKTVYPSTAVASKLSSRRLAIQEALEECNEESRAVTATCERIARDVVRGGKPDVALMRKRCEELYNPDVWTVKNGVLLDSAMNPGTQLFAHGGVYMIHHPNVTERLQPVLEKHYEGRDSATGKGVSREHYVLPVQYTGLALVIDALKIFNGPAVADTLAHVLGMDDAALDMTIVCHQGPPGCGKTTTVVNDADPATTVYLAPTRIAKDGLIEKLVDKRGVPRARARMICRTLDSLLVNYWRLPEDARRGFQSVSIDEYVLARSGKWLAAAALLGVREVNAYGDRKQITHKPRVTVGSFHLELQPDVLEEEFLGFRGAAEICAAYSYVYGNEIRTTVKEPGIVKRVRTFSEVQWKDDCRLLSMLQADKILLNTVANSVGGRKKPIVSTVHEAQGSDCDQVVIYNGETRKRGPEDAFYLYGKTDYCLVAMSRARTEVIYVKMSNEPDVMTAMIERASDVRRIELCKDVSTQGESNVGF